MKKGILAIIIICVILIAFSINVFSVNEETNEILNSEALNEQTNMTLEEQYQDVKNKIEESNSRLEYVESELTTALQKIQELNASIEQYQAEYDNLNNQILQLENEIATTDLELEEIEAKYQKKQDLLKKRTVALYEAGDTTYLDVLLSSGNIIDFISNYYLLAQIIEYDTELIDEIEQERKIIEIRKAQQVKKKTDLKVAKAKANQMHILMENNIMLQESYSATLTEEEKNLQEQIDQYKAEQDELERQIQAAIQWSGTFAIQFTGGVMIWPVGVEGTYITSGYGSRLHPIQGVYKYHDGIDIGNAGFGAPVVAAADGVVTYTGVLGGYGNCVMINHGNGIVTLYGHGQEITTTLGTVVKQGDIIMTVGSTGVSTGPHLHFEVRKNGTAVDPIPYLKGESEDSSQGAKTIENVEAEKVD
ncbi:MAG: murein hydrolase activator EnvC family protein [Clostridia bacterium]